MKHLILLVCLSCSTIFAQTIKTTISTERVGSVTCEYEIYSTEGVEYSDEHFVYLSFQNIEYVSFVDLGVVEFGTMKDIDIFISDLRSCIAKTTVRTDNIAYERSEYHVRVNDDSRLILLEDFEENKTKITKNQALRLISWLEGVQFEFRDY